MHTLPRLPAALLLATSFFAGCSGEPAAASISALTPPKGLEALQLTTTADNPLTEAKAALGKQLFFDTRLSGSGKMSCSSCHLPELAFSDGKRFSTKDDGKDNSRNSPTVHNVGYYDNLYWDGRAKGLEANVLAAWKGQIGGVPDDVAKRLEANATYKKAFTDAFGAGPSETTVVHALASFLRTLRSGDSAFDRAMAGDAKALGENAKKGQELFLGKAGCVTCHTPPLFSDRLYHNIGIGMSAEKPDVGAAKPTGDASKTGAFKTPTLRDIAKTAPYFHDGSVATLREAVQLMAGGGLANPHKDPLALDRQLNDAEIDQLVAFLESLTGNQKFTAPSIPK
ncbi:MAG: c-type cytochrome [Planctomycetes bacterium]|nr:c-type cytochrome [Planctomycetota bacterium]